LDPLCVIRTASIVLLACTAIVLLACTAIDARAAWITPLEGEHTLFIALADITVECAAFYWPTLNHAELQAVTNLVRANTRSWIKFAGRSPTDRTACPFCTLAPVALYRRP
jgi:hypothetical protein